VHNENRINISQTIIKAMSLFGGVQVVSIICSIIRTKLIAIWIGPAGIGLIGLYNSAVEMISTFAGLGIRNSSVRDISLNSSTRNKQRIAIIITVVRRWSWFVGLFGALITISFAPLLSKVTFNDDKHIWGFIALSIVVLVNALAGGEFAVMQGTSRLKQLAQASVWGFVSGLIISIPLILILKINGIVIIIIAYSLMTAIFCRIFRDKEYDKKIELTYKETFHIGTGFIKLGVLMTLSSFITILFSYIFISYLNKTSGTSEVGFYQAGYTLVNKYVGLIFASMGMEYFPRLTKVTGSRRRMSIFVSQEIRIVLLILIPIICGFLLLREFIVTLLYAPEFNVITSFISWSVIGTIFRAVSWCMAFVILAKGSGKLYLITETISALSGFALNILFYHFWGLTGLGFSFVIWYLFYTIIIAIIYKYYYKLKLNLSIYYLIILSVAISVSVLYMINQELLITAVIISVIASAFCIYRLCKLLHL
jgi:putative phospholipid-translocating ATPase